MNKKLNTTVDFELCDGTNVKLTLAFYHLYQLKSKNPSLYKRYNAAMANSGSGNYDELDMITILYAAYMCANMDAETMKEEEFMMLCGSDRMAVANAVKALTSPKKK